LPLCLGEGSKVVPYLNQEDKSYTGIVELGVETDTLDSTGRPIAEAAVPALDGDQLEHAAAGFRGDIEQIPPMFSAIKKEGVPLYRLARQGVEIERQPRRVTIHRLSLAVAGPGFVRLEVDCSKGTYVRSLARDLARALDTVGHLTELRRTRFGRFDVGSAAALEKLSIDSLPLVSPEDALADLRELVTDSAVEARVRLGQQAALSTLPPPVRAGEVAKLVHGDGRLVALVSAGDSAWKIVRVFAS